VILAFAAVGLGLAVFSFVSKVRDSVRSLSILILSPVSCGANLPVLHLSLASPVAHFLLMPTPSIQLRECRPCSRCR
jgi:hypothetical protein